MRMAVILVAGLVALWLSGTSREFKGSDNSGGVSVVGLLGNVDCGRKCLRTCCGFASARPLWRERASVATYEG